MSGKKIDKYIIIRRLDNFKKEINQELDSKQLYLLPYSYRVKEIRYEDNLFTIKKILIEAGLPINTISLKKEDSRIVSESIEWILPAIYIGIYFFQEHPELIANTFSKIYGYLKKTKGIAFKDNSAKLRIVLETKEHKNLEVDYNGPAENLKDLPDVIKSAFDKD